MCVSVPRKSSDLFLNSPRTSWQYSNVGHCKHVLLALKKKISMHLFCQKEAGKGYPPVVELIISFRLKHFERSTGQGKTESSQHYSMFHYHKSLAVTFCVYTDMYTIIDDHQLILFDVNVTFLVDILNIKSLNCCVGFLKAITPPDYFPLLLPAVQEY